MGLFNRIIKSLTGKQNQVKRKKPQSQPKPQPRQSPKPKQSAQPKGKGGHLYSYRDLNVSKKAKSRAPNVGRMKRGGTPFDTKSAYLSSINKRAEKKPIYQHDNHKQGVAVSSGTKRTQEKATYQTRGGRAYTGFVRNAMMAGLPEVKHKEIKDTKSYKAGAVLGDLVGYGLGYGAAGSATAKVGGKIAATAAGKKAASKIATTKAAQKLAKKELAQQGKKVTTKAVKEVAERKAKTAVKLAGKNLAADATIGTALDLAHAKGDNIKGKDLAKYMAVNAAMNVGVGGAMDVAPALVKAKGANKAIREATEANKAKAVQSFKSAQADKKRLFLGGAKKGGEGAHKEAQNALRDGEFSLWAREELARQNASLDVLAKDTGKSKAEIVKDLKKKFDAQTAAPLAASRSERSINKLANSSIPKARYPQKGVKTTALKETDNPISKALAERQAARKASVRKAGDDLSHTIKDLTPNGEVRATKQRLKKWQEEIRKHEGDPVTQKRIIEDATDDMLGNRALIDREIDEQTRSLANDIRNSKFVIAEDVAGDFRGGRHENLKGWAEERGFRPGQVARRNPAKHGVGSRDALDVYEELQEVHGKGLLPDVDSEYEALENMSRVLKADTEQLRGREIPMDDEMLDYYGKSIEDDLLKATGADRTKGAESLAPDERVMVGRADARLKRKAGTKQTQEAIDTLANNADFRRQLKEDLNGKTLRQAAEEAGVGPAEYVAVMKKRYDGENSRLLKTDYDVFLNSGSRGSRNTKALRQKGIGAGLFSEKEITDYIEHSLKTKGIEGGMRPYGVVGENFANQVKDFNKYGVDIKGKHLELSASDIGHMKDRKYLEKYDWNLPVRNDDIKSLPDIIENYDHILEVNPKKIILGKQVNGYSILIEMVDNERNTLRPKTMYRWPTEEYIKRYPQKKPHYGAEDLHISSKASGTKSAQDPFSEASAGKSINPEATNVNSTVKEGGTSSAAKAGDLDSNSLGVGDSLPKEDKIPTAFGDKPAGEAKILTQTPKEKLAAKQKVKNFFRKFAKEWTDEQAAIYELSRATGDKYLNVVTDRVRSLRKVTDQMINGDRQIIVTKNGFKDGGKSAKKILEPIRAEGDEAYEKLSQLMYERLNVERYAADKPVFGADHTVEVSQKWIDDFKKSDPELYAKCDAASKEVEAYFKNLLDAQLDAGTISKEQYKAIQKYNHYLPSYREMPQSGGVAIANNTVGVKDINKLAKGSSRNILPIHEQMRLQTERVMENIAFNDLGTQLAKNLPEGSLRSVEKIKPGEIAEDMITDFDAKKLPKALEEADGEYFFNIRKDGEVYKVAMDKELFDAVAALKKKTPKFTPFNQMNSLLRELTTSANPLFAVRNGFRDFFDCPSFSKYGAGEFYKNYAKAWKMILGKDDLWKAYKAAGGTSGGFIDISSEVANHSWFRRNTLDRIEALNEAVEQAPRFAEFVTTLAHEGNTKEGLLKAFNNANELTVNFGRGGRWGKVVNANGGTFFNAGVQDLVRTSRAIREGRVIPLVTGAVSMGIAPSVINELVCGDDPDYQKLRTSDKDTNFFIPIGDGRFFKIPKGRVVSSIAMPVQRGVREALGNTKEGETVTKGMKKSISEQIAPVNPVEDNILMPFLESVIKKNGETWYGMPIVPQSLQNLPEEEQYDENTTNLAKQLGQITGKSPKKIDYVMKQYSGVLGQLGQNAPIIGQPAAKRNLLYRNFVTDAVESNDLSSRLYDMKNEAEKQKNSRKGTTADQLTYNYLNKGTTMLGEYNKQVKEIQASTKLTNSQKLEKIRDLRRKQNEEAEKYINRTDDVRRYAKEVAKSTNKDDFTSDNAYKAALKTQLDIKVRGADAVFKDEEAKRKAAGQSLLAPRLKEAGISPKKYYELQAKGISLNTYIGARNNNVSVDKYADAKKALKGVKGYGGKTAALLEGGYIKSFKEAKEVYDIKEQSWNAAVSLLNKGYSTQDIIKLDGDYEESQRQIKEYGVTGNGWITQDGLRKWVAKQRPPKGVNISTNAYRAYLWKTHGYKFWQKYNPYE